MNNIDDLKYKITHSKERIKFGFNLIRSMEQRIELKKTEIEEFKFTAEANLLEERTNAKNTLSSAMISSSLYFVIFLHINLLTTLFMAYLSKWIIYVQGDKNPFIEEHRLSIQKATNIFNDNILDTLKYIYLSYDRVDIVLIITFAVIVLYAAFKLYIHCRSLNKRNVSEHIEIHNTKNIKKINCYSGYINKARKEIKEDRVKMREAKYKLRILERN